MRIELELELLKQKGINPYEYLNISKRLGETKLRDKKYFYSSQIDENISDKRLWGFYKSYKGI